MEMLTRCCFTRCPSPITSDLINCFVLLRKLQRAFYIFFYATTCLILFRFEKNTCVIALSVRCLELKILEVLSCLPVAKFSLYRTYTVKCWTQWPKSREIPFPNYFIKADPKVCCRRRRRRWRWWHSGWCPRPPLAIRIDPQFIALLQLPRISDVYLRNFRLSRALQHARNWKSLQVLAYIYSAS